MKPEILAAIKRNTAEMRRRIESGEVKVCSPDNPMPENRDSVGQKWFHEKAYCIAETSETQRVYRCPVCKHEFPVTLRKVQP